MKNKPLNSFRDRPQVKLAWWSMGLGLSVLLVPPFLGIFAAVISPLIQKYVSEKVASFVGFGMLFLVIALCVSVVVIAIKVYRSGERSWVMWLGLVPAVLIVLFWIFMLVGELAFPH